MPTVCHTSTLNSGLLDSNLPEQSENVIENKESRSWEVKELRSWDTEPRRLEVGHRRFVTLRLSTLDFSTQICRNKARMLLKTKGRYSRAGADVAFERLRCAEGAVQLGWTRRPDLSLRDIADPKLRGLRQPGDGAADS